MLSIISTVIVFACLPVIIYLCIRAYLTAKEAERAGEQARYHWEETMRLLEEQRELYKRCMSAQ